MAENNIKYIDHITLPPEFEDSAERTCQIADSDWRKSAARKIKTAHILKWNNSANILDKNNSSKIDMNYLPIGQANGIAPLNEYGIINNEYLPVSQKEDDIYTYSSIENFPQTGEENKIYISTEDNKTYYWNENEYVLIKSDSDSIKSIKIGEDIISNVDQIELQGEGIDILTNNNKITFFTEGSDSGGIYNLLDGSNFSSLRSIGTIQEDEPQEDNTNNSNTYQLGECAVALGLQTTAAGDNQLTIGKYNTQDNNNNYAFIIGNGNYDEENDTITSSNAFTVDWNGNVTISGTPTENNHLVTKSYIDNAISNIKILSAGLADPSYGNWKLPWINFTDPNTGVIYNLSINQNQNQRFIFNFNAKQAGSNSWMTLASITLN